MNSWQDCARQAGFDRMLIHDRDAGDASEVGNFLSVYRNGEAWSRWGFARAGASIRAWCCLTGADVGEYANMDKALAAVLWGGSDRAPDLVVAPSNLVQLPLKKRVGGLA